MRKVEKIEGTPFTKRRTVRQQTETPEELLEGLRAMTRTLEDPWEQQRPLIEWVRRTLDEEIAAHPPGHQFRPREDAGWYLREMLIHAKIVDDHIAKRSASWAAYHGALFGELWSEFQLMEARAELYCDALRLRHAQAQAGEGTRRTPDSVRVERWRHYFALTGKKTESDRLAAEDLGDGESTVREARRKWEKAAAASD